MYGRSFGISTRNSPEVRWTFRRYHNISVFKMLRVFVHSLMSTNFSAFLGRNWIFAPYIKFLTSHAVTETFPILSKLLSHEPGRYVKHQIAACSTTFLRGKMRSQCYIIHTSQSFKFTMSDSNEENDVCDRVCAFVFVNKRRKRNLDSEFLKKFEQVFN